MMNNKFKLSATIFASIIALAACGITGNESDSAASESATEEQAEYTVGVVGDTERLVWEDVAERVADEGITLNVETFT
ncbi:MAG TPA: MetQ/NlpA family ABC transporter substrate-binding protein, partial [Aerococcus urinaeequi]|nr:MetQ/NlpA family ABC transporter substrate-binding protein [Aerococcus urinaeequi]